MKKILTVAFLLIAIVSYSQQYTNNPAWGVGVKRFVITEGDTTTTKIAGGLTVKNGILYIGNGIYWSMVTGSGGSTDSLIFATWRRMYKVNDSMKVVYNSLYNFTNGYGLNKSSLTFSVDTTAIQKKLSAGTGIAISGNTIYNTGSTSTGRVYAGTGLRNVNDSTVATDTTTAVTGTATVGYALNLHNIALAAISQYISDSLGALTRLRAGTSAGVKLLSNSGATVAEYGLGGGTNFDFHGFAGYDANRSSSYTARSFVTKNDLDSTSALKQDVKLTSKGLLIGNSTIASYSCGIGIENFLTNKADSAIGNTVYNQAVPGDSIVGQMNIFLADANKATYDWIIVEIGLNDLQPSISAATTLVKYQKLVDTIKSVGKSGVKIIVSVMIPPKQRLIDVYGAVDGLIAYQKWLDMNNAIMGGQPNRITNVDYRIDKHNSYLNDGFGNLAHAYDCGDHIHENNTARNIIAQVWREQLNHMGFLTTKIPALLYTDNTDTLTQQLTDGTTITFDAQKGVNAYVTLGDNRTLTFSNFNNGMTLSVVVIQDGTGGRTLTIPGCKVIGGGAGAITLSTAANAQDILTFWRINNIIYCNYGKNYN